MKYYFNTLHDRLEKQMRKVNINKMLDLIPSQYHCIEESERLMRDVHGEPEYRDQWLEGAYYVRNYFFNKLNKQKMKHDETTILLCIKALGLTGIQADAKTLTLITHMYEMVNERGGGISLNDITDLQQWVEKQYPEIVPDRSE